MWGAGPFERIARTLAPMHEHVVRELAPQRSERWLDVGSGTGALAERLAERGAQVTGVDLAPRLVETAVRRASERGLDVRYDVGDAETLPYPDESFDGVASAVGVVFTGNQERAAGEMARVCRLGGRIGLTAWLRSGGVGDFFDAMAQFEARSAANTPSHFDWSNEERVNELLCEHFSLVFAIGDAPYLAASPEAAWEELSVAYGPTRALAESLDSARRDKLRRAVVAFYEQFRAGDGICHHREYRLVRGRRR
jgi:SAM-dependent methyltransferase